MRPTGKSIDLFNKRKAITKIMRRTVWGMSDRFSFTMRPIVKKSRRRGVATRGARKVTKKLGTPYTTVMHVWKKYNALGIEGIRSKPRLPKLTNKIVRELFKIIKNTRPSGKKRWTYKLLQKELLVRFGINCHFSTIKRSMDKLKGKSRHTSPQREAACLPDSILCKPRGRPQKLNPDLVDKLEKIFENSRPPGKLGWTYKLLQDKLWSRFDISCSISTIQRAMSGLDWTFRRAAARQRQVELRRARLAKRSARYHATKATTRFR